MENKLIESLQQMADTGKDLKPDEIKSLIEILKHDDNIVQSYRRTVRFQTVTILIIASAIVLTAGINIYSSGKQREATIKLLQINETMRKALADEHDTQQ